MKTAEEKERLFKIFRSNAQRSVIGVAIEEDDFDDLADAIIEEYANKQMKELLEWLKEYRLNTMSLMRIGDYEQGQIDVLTDVINRVDPNRCSYCGKEGFHKLSCTNNTGAIKMSVSSEDFHLREIKQRPCKNHVWRKDYLNGGWKCQVCTKTKEDGSN